MVVEAVASSVEENCAYCPWVPYVGSSEIWSNTKKYKSLHNAQQSDGLRQDSLFQDPLIVTDQFVVVPTIGCYMEGYLLAVSRKHIYSISELQEDELNLFDFDISSIVARLNGEFYGNNYLVFEHGSAGPERPGGSCVRHAHMHLIPVPVFTMQTVKRSLPFDPLPTGNLSDLKQFAWCGRGIDEGGHEANYAYLDITNYSARNGAHVERYAWMEVDEVGLKEFRLPGQWIRKTVAENLKIDEWDWAVDAGRKNAQITANVVRQHFPMGKL